MITKEADGLFSAQQFLPILGWRLAEELERGREELRPELEVRLKHLEGCSKRARYFLPILDSLLAHGDHYLHLA